MGRISARKRVNLGLVVLNFTERGFTSWTLRPFPRVSWNSRTRRWTVDLPGPWTWKSGPTRRP